MSILTTDLVARGTVNMDVSTDAVTVGGAIDPLAGINLVGDATYAATEGLDAVSASAGDTTQTVSIWVWTSSAGTLNAPSGAAGFTGVLNGTTAVVLATAAATFRLVKATVSASTAGIVTVRKTAAGGDRAVIRSDTPTSDARCETSAYRLFIGAYADPSSPIIRYNKFFWKNAHASLTAVAPVYRLTADPQAKIRVGIHTSINDTVTVANRLTTPGGVTFVDDNIDQTGPDLATLDKQGIWVEFTSPAAGTGFQDSFTHQITAGSI